MRASPWWAAAAAICVPVSGWAQSDQRAVVEPPTAVAAAPAPSPSETTALAARGGRDLVWLEGLVDGYFSARPGGAGAQPFSYHRFDAAADTFSLAYAKLGLSVRTEPVGFRIVLGHGPVATAVAGATGVSAEQAAIYQNIPQAYLTFAIPVLGPSSSPLTIDVGKFVTSAGAEVIDANKNWSYSRSFLFNYAIPFTHTGVRATLPVSSWVTLQAMVANGWDLVFDNNRAKTLGLSATINASTGTTVIVNGLAGVEAPGGAWRFLADLVVTQTVGNFGLVVNADYAKEGPVSWYGVAAYARYALLEHLALALRGEIFKDAQNARLAIPAALGVPGATLESLTFTVGVPFGGFAELRAEARGDLANQPIFITGGTPLAPAASSHQVQLLAAALAWF